MTHLRHHSAIWTSTNPTLASGQVGLETDTWRTKVGDGSTAWNSLPYKAVDSAVSSVFGRTGAVVAASNDYSEAQISFTDITTNNSSTSKHGFLPKLDNNSAHFLDGTGAWSTPSGGGGGTTIGRSQLVYRYTVSGSDKASIDTGADTANAGDNDWTGGDLLEMFFVSRTDDAGAIPSFDVILNNDTGGNYDLQNIQGNNSTAAASRVGADSKWRLFTHGSGGSASYPGECRITIPNFTGTTFFKIGDANIVTTDATAGNNFADLYGLGYRSTSAITRLKVAGVSTAKFKVGSQLLIYKRLSS